MSRECPKLQLQELEEAIKDAPDQRQAIIEFMMGVEKGTGFWNGRDLGYYPVEFCEKYGEPGYTDPEAGIFFADWNHTEREFGDFLEEMGFAIEWCDEWTVHDDKAYRTSGNSWFWEPQLFCTEDGYIGPEDGIEVWIEAMKDAPDRCLPSRITEAELIEAGWVKHNGTYESGWHPGQNDDPKKIYDALIKRKDVESVIFRKEENSQFYIQFEAYILPREEPSDD